MPGTQKVFVLFFLTISVILFVNCSNTGNQGKKQDYVQGIAKPVPIYPGSRLVDSGDSGNQITPNPPPPDSNQPLIRCETNDSVEKVMGYYDQELVRFGWKRNFWIPIGDSSHVSSWTHNTSKQNIIITVGKLENGNTAIGIQRAT
ncbi:hypothetical protein JW979_10540 [bacterium]|nr:hypothetical protein [candidate division CSSED10-310 bacterium]